MAKKLTYKSSGVDTKKASEFVRSIRRLTDSNAMRGFASAFAFDKKKYKNPVLVSSADGVGTKLMIANHVGKHDTVGIDLVAMNVNDILCIGARPLFFLDYIACGKLKPAILKQVVKGITAGCRRAGCALIGGETAEMPGIYKRDDYDLAGFAIGVVEKDKMINGSKIKAGDSVIGLASSGLHSNGFSMVRKVFSRAQQKKMAGELLKPTRIYVKEVLSLLGKFNIKGIAHITGGAFYEKLTKIIPPGKCCAIDKTSWTPPKIFRTIQKKGGISQSEMFRTFNMGIGMVLVVDKRDVSSIKRFLSLKKVKFWEVGVIIQNSKKRIVL